VITRREARRLGVTRRQIDWLVTTGEWTAPYPGVYVHAAAERSEHQDLRVALAAAGLQAAGSHLSAAWLWGLVGSLPLPLHITVPANRHPTPGGVRIFRSNTLNAATVTAYRGLACTNPLRTLVDCATLVTPGELADLLDRAVAQRLVRLDRLEQQLRPRPGRRPRGIVLLRQVLDERGLLGGPAPSVLESKTARLIRRYGIAVPEAEVVWGPDGRYRLDYAFPDRPLVLEVHGWIAHTPVQQRRATIRRNQLNRAGLTVLEYDWWQIVHEPDTVAVEIFAAHRDTAPYRSA
jgi:hypothetical protein